MKLKLEEIQRLCSAVGVQIDATGRVQIASDLTQADYVAKVHSLLGIDRDVQTVVRFAIGDLVRSMPGIDKGFLKAFCIETFGEQLGLNAMNYQWCAAHWDGLPRDVGWGWTWYRLLNRFPVEVKRHFIARWKEPDTKKRIRYKQFRADLAAMLEPAHQITAVISDHKPDYTCLQSSVYVESRQQAEQFLQYTATRADLLALSKVAAQRVLDFDDETDQFAEEE